MKKLLSVLLAVCLVLSMVTMAAVSVGAATADDATTGATTLTLKPNNDWLSDGARFAAYFWKEDGTSTWVNMTAGSNGNYTVSAPDGYENVLFGRMNPSGSNSFDANDLWNQTDDLKVADGSGKIYEITGWDNSGQWINGGSGSGSSGGTTGQGTTVTLKPNSDWLSDGARFAVYAWNASGVPSWVNMTAASNGTYTATVAPGFTDFLFARMNPNGNNDFESGNLWNQTDDLKVADSVGKVYEITGWDYSGQWIAGTTPVPAGDFYLVGTMNNWTPAAEYKMAAQNDGTYKITKNLTAGTGIKVAASADGSTVTAWYPDGTDNEYIVNATDEVTVVFTPSTGAYTVTYKNGPVGTTLTLKPNTDWLSDGARFAAYFWKTDGTSAWANMTAASDGTYTVEAPAGYDNVLFARMNPDTTTNSFDSNVLWNQTGDLLVANGVGKVYEITGWDNSGQWITGTTPAPTGDYYLVGTMNNWTPSAEYKMAAQNDGTYKITKVLEAGTGIKVGASADGTTVSAWYPDGMDNETVIAATDEVAVVFNPANGTFTVTYKHGSPAVALKLKPNTDWLSDDARFAAYFWKDDNSATQWVNLTPSENGIYTVTAPSGYENVLFARMNPASTTNSFDADVMWNQTDDLKVNDGVAKVYEITGWDLSGQWVAETVTPDPVKDYYLVGTMNNWAPAAEYKMAAQTDGTYKITKTLTAGTGIKVGGSADGTTISAWYPDGVDNETIISATDEVTVVFTPSTGAFIVSYKTVQPTTTLKLKPNTDWASDSARFAAYFWKADGTTTQWKNMTAAGNGIYTVEAPEGYANVLFARMNPAVTTNSFDEGTLWNQTENLLVANGVGKVYEITGWETGQWVNDGPVPTANYYLVGDMNTWTPNAAYKLTAGANGTYTLTTPVEKNQKMKVAKSTNGTTIDENGYYPGGTDNDYVATETGDATITFYPNGNVTGAYGGYFTVTYTAPVESHYYVVGDMNNWTPNASYKMAAGANGTFTLTTTLAKNQKLKVAKSTNGTTIDENGYYPGGTDNDYAATQSGSATITFYPNGNSGSTENGGFFTVTFGTTPDPDGAGYYIVKDANEWTVQSNMKLSKNNDATGTEYMLQNVHFLANEGFKVVYSADGSTITTYYPDGTNNDAHAPAAGIYTVYFRPNADGDETSGWYAKCIYLVEGQVGNLLGDINGDGQVTIQDVTELQRALAEFTTLTDIQRAAADVNKDGRVNVKDVTEIQRFLANLRPAF